MTPSAAVLRAMRLHPERWSLMPHRNDDEPDRKLALEIVERMLPARYRAGLPTDNTPLTMSFVVRAAALLGVKLGQRHAYRVRALALESFYVSGWHPRASRHGLPLFRLRVDRFRARTASNSNAGTAAELLSAVERSQVLMQEIFGGRSPP